ncbi:hypothetical protein [Candidatus Ferrigenium straubiae]|jgi:hypothetical protein|uniref:hypothetical protein n=1 Tax=Candidatus Ferrigenium straubiae TaxID=2919506 RepID=UPI003F4AC879
MTIEHDKATLLAALRKPVLIQQQLDKIISRASRTASPLPPPPHKIPLWRLYKESTAFLADGMAVWPALGIATHLDYLQGWMHQLWMAL